MYLQDFCWYTNTSEVSTQERWRISSRCVRIPGNKYITFVLSVYAVTPMHIASCTIRVYKYTGRAYSVCCIFWMFLRHDNSCTSWKGSNTYISILTMDLMYIHMRVNPRVDSHVYREHLLHLNGCYLSSSNLLALYVRCYLSYITSDTVYLQQQTNRNTQIKIIRMSGTQHVVCMTTCTVFLKFPVPYGLILYWMDYVLRSCTCNIQVTIGKVTSEWWMYSMSITAYKYRPVIFALSDGRCWYVVMYIRCYMFFRKGPWLIVMSGTYLRLTILQKSIV